MKLLIEESHSFLHIALYFIKFLIFIIIKTSNRGDTLNYFKSNSHSHPFACTYASQKSTSVLT